LTAWELEEAGIPHAVIADSAAGAMMARGEVDVVVTGADRIAANGDTANKIGTYSLAVLAAHHEIPFYVVAPSSTVDHATVSGLLRGHRSGQHRRCNGEGQCDRSDEHAATLRRQRRAGNPNRVAVGLLLPRPGARLTPRPCPGPSPAIA